MFGAYAFGWVYLGESGYFYAPAFIYNPNDLLNRFIDYLPETIPIDTYAAQDIDESGDYGLELV